MWKMTCFHREDRKNAKFLRQNDKENRPYRGGITVVKRGKNILSKQDDLNLEISSKHFKLSLFQREKREKYDFFSFFRDIR